MADILTKDLPDVSKIAKALDTSAVDVLDVEILKTRKQAWACEFRSNKQLVELIQSCPEKVTRLQALIDKDLVGEINIDNINDKIARLKEQYAVCLKEIEMRKSAVKE